MNVCKNCGTEFEGAFCPGCGIKYDRQVYTCKNCGKEFVGRFCPECGTKYEPTRICPECGAEVRGKFCSECGARYPDESDLSEVTLGSDSSDDTLGSDSSDDTVRHCAKCGAVVTDRFCSVCGTEYEHRVVCRRCGFVYTGSGCPECGTSAIMDGFLDADVSDVPYTAEEDVQTAVVRIAVSEPEDEVAAKSRKLRLMIFSSLGLFGVLAIFVFTFFTGVTYKYYGNRHGGSMLYYFFGSIYSNISSTDKTAGYIYAVFGTIICALLIIAMVTMTVRCILKYVKCAKIGEGSDYFKTVMTMYLIYVALVLMYRSMTVYYYNYDGAVIKNVLNGATIAGLISGGVLVGAAYFGNIICQEYGKKPGELIKKYVMPILCAVFIIVSMIFLTNGIIKFSYHYYYSGSLFTSDYTVTFKYDFISLSTLEEDTLVWGVFAQLAAYGFVVCGSLAVRKILLGADNLGERGIRLKRNIIWMIVVYAALTFFVIVLMLMVNDCFSSTTYTEKTFIIGEPLVATLMFVAFLVTFGVYRRMCRNRRIA